jgi:hypothetical protein
MAIAPPAEAISSSRAIACRQGEVRDGTDRDFEWRLDSRRGEADGETVDAESGGGFGAGLGGGSKGGSGVAGAGSDEEDMDATDLKTLTPDFRLQVPSFVT